MVSKRFAGFSAVYSIFSAPSSRLTQRLRRVGSLLKTSAESHWEYSDTTPPLMLSPTSQSSDLNRADSVISSKAAGGFPPEPVIATAPGAPFSLEDTGMLSALDTIMSFLNRCTTAAAAVSVNTIIITTAAAINGIRDFKVAFFIGMSSDCFW